MKKSLKIALSATAAVAVAGAAAVPAIVSAWGDNGGGRESYTIEQINQGVLGDKIVFNSISDSVIGSEKNFVGARENTGINAGADNVWNGNDITVEEGKTYIIRLYVHNNNPGGENAIARDVTTSFSVPGTSGKTVEVNGYISSSNATPSEYWDYVRFHSDRDFYLDYIEGSALLENNGIGANGGIKLSDNAIKESGVKIGYNALDGNVPGCYRYANYITIEVKPVFVNQYTVSKTARLEGEKTWSESVKAEIGDKVQFQIEYTNKSGDADDVMVKDILPENLKYVPGTTTLYNSLYPSGATVGANSDTITTTAVNIGDYATNSNAFVRLTAEVVDENLSCGENTLTNWGKVSVGETVGYDSANVVVEKACEEPDEPDEPVTPDQPETPETPEEDKFPEEMPKTGLNTVAGSIIGAGALATSAGYYVASRRQLRR